MKVLWAPWRIEYILGEKEKECIFCTKPKEHRDRENLILYRGKLAFIIMNKYPYTSGHLMVVPYRHVHTLEELNTEELTECMTLTVKSLKCLRKIMHPNGFNVGLNIGVVASASIDEHLHWHIVPRWAGDVGFMTILDDIRVIPEHILATYDKLHPCFKEESK